MNITLSDLMQSSGDVNEGSLFIATVSTWHLILIQNVSLWTPSFSKINPIINYFKLIPNILGRGYVQSECES